MQDEKQFIETGQNLVRAEMENLSEEGREAIEVYQAITQQVSAKIAQKLAPPGTIGTDWQKGATYLDAQASEVVEDIMRRFQGVMNLSEFVAFSASMAGYQAGVAKASGMELPDDLYEQAGQIFAAGMRLVSVTTEHVMKSGKGPAMVPGIPQQG